MGCAFGRRPGGICGLLDLPREDWEAIESDLLSRGFTLADIPERVSWRAVVAMLRWPWGHAEHLAASVVDLLAVLVWQNTDDGQRGVNRPERLPRPGDTERRRQEVESMLAVAREQGWIE